VASIILDGLDELFHDVGRSGEVGVAHSQVDDIVSPPPGLHLQVIDDGKNVGRQPSDTVKFFHSLKPQTRKNMGEDPKDLGKPPRTPIKNKKNLESRSGGSSPSISKLPNPCFFVKIFAVHGGCPLRFPPD
jgi:hypothetical protein